MISISDSFLGERGGGEGPTDSWIFSGSSVHNIEYFIESIPKGSYNWRVIGKNSPSPKKISLCGSFLKKISCWLRVPLMSSKNSDSLKETHNIEYLRHRVFALLRNSLRWTKVVFTDNPSFFITIWEFWNFNVARLFSTSILKYWSINSTDILSQKKSFS